PEPDPPRRLPERRPVVDVRPAAGDRLQGEGHRPDLQGPADEAGRPGSRPRRPGADLDGHRRRGDRARPAARARAEGVRPDRDARSRRAARDARLMSSLLALPVALPLLVAAALIAGGRLLPLRIDELIGIVTAAAAA